MLLVAALHHVVLQAIAPGDFRTEDIWISKVFVSLMQHPAGIPVSGI